MTPIEAPATIDYRLSTIDYEEVTIMEQKKVCPLRVSAGFVAQGASWGLATLPDGWPDCLGPACAWYDQAAERCALLTIARKA